MMTARAILSLGLAITAVIAAPGPDPPPPPPPSAIEWKPCPATLVRNWPPKEAAEFKFECGLLEVPLDYTESDGPTNTMRLLRIPANLTQSQPRSVLYNPGGPGSGGVGALVRMAKHLVPALRGRYHLVTFDPRGTGENVPFSCYNSTQARLQMSARFESLGLSQNPSAGEAWVEQGILADACKIKNTAPASEPYTPNTGELIGTAFVAQDMMRIVDALQEDGMLRYWGFSYGSVLGATAAAMYPQRIDRMVLDGVADPVAWYKGDDISHYLGDIDKVLSEFCRDCVVDSPKECALAQLKNGTITARELETEIYLLIERHQRDPVPGAGAAFPFVLDDAFLRLTIFNSLYSRKAWTNLAGKLHALMKGESPSWGNSMMIPSDAFIGITCADAGFRSPRLDEFLPLAELARNASKIIGDAAAVLAMKCARWGMMSKQRYVGDFRAKTNTSILLLSNTHDPVTPLSSARYANDLFAGSVLLEQSDIGHCTIANGFSDCTARSIADYFAYGSMPAPSTKCPRRIATEGGQKPLLLG